MSARASYCLQDVHADGRMEPFNKEKLVNRIIMSMDLGRAAGDEDFLAAVLTEILMSKLTSPVKSSTIDYLLAGLAADMQTTHLAYASVATDVELERIYAATEPSFFLAMERASYMLSDEFLRGVRRHRAFLDDMVDETRDRRFSFFALRSIARTYLLRDGDALLERPQHLWARVAFQIHQDDLENVRATYNLLSTFQAMFASPILFNSGLKRPQMSSCFLLPAEKDPDDIFHTLSRAADISRGGGGIGLGLQSVPGKGSTINGITRSGLTSVVKLFDCAMEMFDQGTNKRPSAISASIEPWHCDVLPFIRMKRAKGMDSDRARKIFFTLWVPDIFIRRVTDNKDWTLFCPSIAGRLCSLYGEAYDSLYLSLEERGLGTETIKARDIWLEMVTSQFETGGPSIMFKDSINRKSNEKHIGTITQSNLCTEITQFTHREETAVCTLASLVLPSFINKDNLTFNFDCMEDAARLVVYCLNKVIDVSSYPCSATRESANAHRAVGIGYQGLADTLAIMGIPYDSNAALSLSTTISEGIQYSAYDESCNLTRVFGTYSTFDGSPLSQGWFQHDMWNVDKVTFSGRYDWGRLREKVVKGTCNALLTAAMPTAGTTQITGCSESFEAFASLYYTRKVIAGEFAIIPRHLIERLSDIGLWDDELCNLIIANNGSIQNIQSIPTEIRDLYKTVWEIPQERIVRMAAARGPFICQSQSMSLYVEDPTFSLVSRLLSLGWKLGLKTGLYYLRTKSASKALPVTLPVQLWSIHGTGSSEDPVCLACSA